MSSAIVRIWTDSIAGSVVTMTLRCRRPPPHRSRITLVSILALPCLAVGAAQSPTDRDVLSRIRTEGMERSQAAAVFNHLTIDIGPRLTASPAHKRAVDWTRDRLQSYGLANVHVEPGPFGLGWT